MATAVMPISCPDRSRVRWPKIASALRGSVIQLFAFARGAWESRSVFSPEPQGIVVMGTT
jgi:hypothetical protein